MALIGLYMLVIYQRYISSAGMDDAAVNPGPLEEGAKVASGFVEAMRGNPLALALAASNIMLLAIFAYVANWAGNNRATEFAAIMAMQREVQQLLYRCTPDKPNG
jgi:hypothetical protein